MFSVKLRDNWVLNRITVMDYSLDSLFSKFKEEKTEFFQTLMKLIFNRLKTTHPISLTIRLIG